MTEGDSAAFQCFYHPKRILLKWVAIKYRLKVEDYFLKIWK